MRTYKEKDKGSTTLAIVYNPRVFDNDSDNILRELCSLVDVFFIFPRYEIRKKRLRKFTNLYGAVYYGIQEDDETECDLIYEALEYGKELGGGYLGYFVIENNCFLSSELLPKISYLGNSLIDTSVWHSFKTSLQDFRSIFEVGSSWYERLLAYFLIDPRAEISRMFESHVTTDPVLFLREITLTRLDEYFKDHPVYYNSFRKSCFGTFISSAVEKTCPSTKININIKDAKA